MSKSKIIRTFGTKYAEGVSCIVASSSIILVVSIKEIKIVVFSVALLVKVIILLPFPRNTPLSKYADLSKNSILEGLVFLKGVSFIALPK